MNAFNDLCRRLERAQSEQNRRMNQSAGGEALPLGGGWALLRGEGHFLNQALGQVEPVTEAELDAAEALLGKGGHPVVLELSPGADPGLWPLLAQRGYRVHQFQHLLTRTLEELPPEEDPGFELRPVQPGEVDTFGRVVFAAFSERDDWREGDSPFFMPRAAGVQSWLVLVEGEPAGGCTLGCIDGVALLSGDGVLPRFRGRGIQKALIRARLRAARELGCDLACASTLPSTPSQRAYERCGFRVAYPKLEMAKG